MLKEFKIRNFKSFKNEEILSLKPVDKKEENLDPFNIAYLGENKILKSAVIYGHNSFGKSNLFKGLHKMISIIRYCINSDYIIQVDDYKLDDISENKPTMFEISFILNNIVYTYGFEVFKNLVVKEWLYKKDGLETKIFQRKGSLNNTITLNSKYKDYEKYVEFTKESELFLSSMEKNNVSGEIKDIFDYISNKIKVFSIDMVVEKKLGKNQILKTLKTVDLKVYGPEAKKEGEILENIISDFEENEIVGSKKLYYIMDQILDALNNGEVLFIDELDYKLNNLIVKYLIGLFHDLSINKKNAQLVFNTYDVYLLEEELFRRDQIYFTDKDEYGVTTLYSLGDFKGVKRKTNLLAHYLAGHFGPIGNIKEK